MRGFGGIAVAVFVWSVSAAMAHAAVTVFGGNLARACYEAAKFGDVRSDAYANCTLAIENDPLTTQDLAGTYVNRGVISMEHQDWRNAQSDFEQAMRILPTLGEAVCDRGADLVAQRQFTQGVSDLTRCLTMSPGEPEKAYYNRALAYEALDDEKSAYFDYLRASQLAPKWPAPQKELSRFTVTRR